MSKLTQIAKSVYLEATKDKGFVKGEDFEHYVEMCLFPENKYDLIYRTPSETTNAERFVESSLYPDFQFRDRKTKRNFWVEAKYRQDSYKNKIMWATEAQLKRYKEYDKKLPVFVAIGVGGYGTASIPEFLFIVPVRQIQYVGLYDSFLRKYEIYNPNSKNQDRPIKSNKLWGLL
jgi:hypothetical protein|tara:strand:+ start:263 stop:787 length:525 start_codon:yes stop_codon:yes gene_type:complete